MMVLHANWTGGTLRIWAESLSAFHNLDGASRSEPTLRASDSGGTTVLDAPAAVTHAFAASPEEVAAALEQLVDDADAEKLRSHLEPSEMVLRLPSVDQLPAPGDRLAASAGVMEPVDCTLERFAVPCQAIDPREVLFTLIRLDSDDPPDGIDFGHDLRYWLTVGRFVIELLAAQRFIPTLMQSREAGLQAQWQPWLHDDEARARAGALIRAMPPVVRAVDDGSGGQPWPILEQALRGLVDQTVRRILIEEEFGLALDERDPDEDTHVAFLAGLLGDRPEVVADSQRASDLLRDVGVWMARLDESSQSQALRLGLRLTEPEIDSDTDSSEFVWRLSLHLHAADGSGTIIDAEQIWGLDGAAAGLSDLQTVSADEFLLTELRRAGRIYPQLETSLTDSTPTGVNLTTAEAYQFLCEFRPLLEETGVIVEPPEWWEDPTSQLGIRLQIKSDPADAPVPRSAGVASNAPSHMGLNALVRYEWQVAVGDEPLTAEEFDQLTRESAPIARIGGRWVQLHAENLEQGLKALREQPGGEVTLLEAIQMAMGVTGDRPQLPVLGLDADGWVADLLDSTTETERIPELEQPKLLRGELRPYQVTGLSWLAFLDSLGLGACLADDMGLGKTIQLIALMQHERQYLAESDPPLGPTLLLVPTSLIGNWTREMERFAPEITVHVQHGPERPVGEEFVSAIANIDMMITTYGLVTRDRDMLQRTDWHRIVLDEAQYIKNPPTKQTSAIRALNSRHRVALTGTPVENRLSEMWSIMEFCNPGYLGSPADFRRRFAVPIERHRDPEAARVLRQLVRPFVLRRLKTDSTVIDDLPPCLQTKEYANLTTEQAAVYQQVVDRMLNQVDVAEGMQRRGLVLSTLVRLKQVCDHPALILSEGDSDVKATVGPAFSSRSGKSKRLVTMLEEILASDGRSLIFTQFRRMGQLLLSMLQHELNTEVQFLHGGTPQKRRQQMIDRFQDPKGDMPIFILSLKAGGVGLNLTAANHVFHYDRWWNPAVENQATDRAFRIGQTRTVHVHKFVCVGTLEERIDQMIEQKTELAENIIGSGEDWLTEMSATQLHDVLKLRQSAMEQDS